MILDIYIDHVVFEGMRINRPSRITRSVWLGYWERIKLMKGTK